MKSFIKSINLSRLIKDDVLLQLIKKSGAFLFTRVGGIVLGFLLSWYVGIKGGAGLWGNFIIYYSILNVLTIFSLLGLDSITVKHISESKGDNSRKSDVLSQIVMLVFISSLSVLLVVSLGCFLLWDFNDFVSTNFSDLKYVILMIPAFSLIRIFSAHYRGEENVIAHGAIKNLLIFGGLGVMLLIISCFSVVTLSPKILLLSLMVLIYGAFLFLFARFIYEGKFKIYFSAVFTNIHLLREALPLLLVASLALLTGYTDIFMLRYFEDESIVGIYDIAIKFSSVVSIFLGAINAYVMPKFASYHKSKKRDDLALIVRKSSLLILVTTLPLLLLLFILSNFLMGLYGLEYLTGTTALRILIAAQVVSAVCGSVAILLQMTDNQGAFQNIFLSATILNVILNFILIPKFGITGAAIATLISTAFWNIGAAAFAKIKLDILTVYWPTRLSFR